MRARKCYLFDEYKKQASSVDKLVQDIQEAVQITQSKADNEENKDKKEMVSKGSREEKDRCVEETAAAFRDGGAVNSYLSGGQSPH